MNPSAQQFNHIVAFEVSKHELVVHSLPLDRQERITNSQPAARRLLKREAARNLKQGWGAATGGLRSHRRL